MKRLNINEKEAEHQIRKEDKRRADNYRYYTGRIWGTAANFDLTVNTDFGVEYIEESLKKLVINIIRAFFTAKATPSVYVYAQNGVYKQAKVTIK